MSDKYVTVGDFVSAIELLNQVYLFDMFLGGVVGGAFGALFTLWITRD